MWEMAQLLAALGLLSGFCYVQRKFPRLEFIENRNNKIESKINSRITLDINDAEAVDPGLLKKHSEIRSFTTTRYTYPSLRIFFREHPQAAKLPVEPAPLPLLVFIHGLGGSTYQFHALLTSLVNLASCLSIDLPGCGLSTMSPTSWDAYTTESLTELLGDIIEEYRDKSRGQNVVLIGHSMGCSLGALLASKTSPHPHPLANHVVGLLAICPKADPPTEDQVATYRKLLMIPNFIFDTWRKWDQRGGADSASVIRFVGTDADGETKKLQARYNSQSKTAVFRRMASGSLPVYIGGKAKGGLPGREVWSGLECPVFLVAGEADHVTKPEELEKITSFLGKSHSVPIGESETGYSAGLNKSASPFNICESSESESRGTIGELPDDSCENSSTLSKGRVHIPPQPNKPKKALKTTILPSPASHALLYMPSSVRILAGLISDFLCSRVSPRLSLGWQLQFLSTSGKWDVKNLAKWQAIKPVSEPISGIFCAMKTLREVDDTHCPGKFVQDWGAQIKDIVDISHESPVYDPQGLEDGGIQYTKFPTVSKIPPTIEEVSSFIKLIDNLREQQQRRAEEQGWNEEHYIGVHCHYGFNRTGFFIVCYLIERCGYTVQGAINEFAKKRPKGIKHAHFLDEVYVRYCVGLKRADTL